MRISHARKAFTLIELLVVVAIIALLVAMLIPSLSQAKEIVRYNVCKANMKQTSTAWHGFAAVHENRFPGYARSIYEYWGVCWMQILNREWFRGNDPACYPTTSYGDEPPIYGPLIRFWDFRNNPYYPKSLLGKKYMTCTNYKGWPGDGSGNVWSRPWIANNHAVCGHYYNPYASSGDWGYQAIYTPNSGFYEDGIVLPDSRVPNRVYLSPNGYYCLGRRTDTWANASIKYLMWEAEAGNDFNRWQGGDVNGTIPLNVNNTDTSKAPWCNQAGTGSSGQFAFRHMLPMDQSLWQQRARAPVLYVDGHIGEWNPSADQYRSRNFNVSE